MPKLGKNENIQITMQNFKAIGATSFEFTRDEKFVFVLWLISIKNFMPRLKSISSISAVMFAFPIFDSVKPWDRVKNKLLNFAISFVCIWSTLIKKSSAENVCMCFRLPVCLSVCVFGCVTVSCQFFVELHVVCTDRSEILNAYLKIFFSRTLLTLAMICRKFSFLDYIVVFA